MEISIGGVKSSYKERKNVNKLLFLLGVGKITLCCSRWNNLLNKK